MKNAAVEQTPAPEGVVDQVAVVEEAPADDKSVTDLLGEIWDKSQGEGDEPQEEAAAPEDGEGPTDEVEEPTEDAEEPEDEPQDAAPTDLPKALQDHWKTIPAEAREAFVNSQREMAKKLGEAGRLQRGLRPIQDSLVRAAQEMPFLADMKPEQVAAEVFELAKISQRMQTDPVNTVMEIIDRRGMRQAVAQAMLGRQAPPDQQNTQVLELAQQNRKLMADLQTMAERLEGVEKAPVAQMVSEFASGSEHWAEVEPGLPAAIQYVQAAEPGLSAKDTLAKAFSMELQRLGKAPPPAANKAAAMTDPQQRERAMKAKSVNVKSNSSGKPPAKTERELLSDIYDKHNRGG